MSHLPNDPTSKISATNVLPTPRQTHCTHRGPTKSASYGFIRTCGFVPIRRNGKNRPVRLQQKNNPSKKYTCKKTDSLSYFKTKLLFTDNTCPKMNKSCLVCLACMPLSACWLNLRLVAVSKKILFFFFRSFSNPNRLPPPPTRR